MRRHAGLHVHTGRRQRTNSSLFDVRISKLSHTTSTSLGIDDTFAPELKVCIYDIANLCSFCTIHHRTHFLHVNAMHLDHRTTVSPDRCICSLSSCQHFVATIISPTSKFTYPHHRCIFLPNSSLIGLPECVLMIDHGKPHASSITSHRYHDQTKWNASSTVEPIILNSGRARNLPTEDLLLRHPPPPPPLPGRISNAQNHPHKSDQISTNHLILSPPSQPHQL